MMGASFEARADDEKHGMTLDELARFVQGAMRLGIDGNAKVFVYVNWKAGIKTLKVGGEP